ncbi:MAG: HAD family hydrolase [Candidatus Geothermincolia bacterium]
MSRKRYLNLLADVDGTLIDSNDRHAEAWVEAFARFGHEVDVRAVRKLIGMGGKDIVRFILSQKEADDRTEELSEAHKEIFERRFLPALAVIGEPASLFGRLKELGVSTYLVSSSYEALIEALLDKLAIRELVSGYTTSSDVERAKPAPDVLCAAISKFSLSKESCVFLGDTPFDLIPALRIGIPMIGVESGGYDHRALEGVEEIYRDIRDLEDRLSDSLLSQ